MTKRPSGWSVPGLVQLAAALALIPAVALLARTAADKTARPVPAAFDTLARFLPVGASRPRVEPSNTKGIFRFKAESPGQEYSGEITARGTLIWLASPAEPDDLPAELRESLVEGSALQNPRLERVQLMAYEVETRRPDGSELERFLDPLGNLLFEVESAPEPGDGEAGDDGISERFEDLQAPVARALHRHLGATAPSRLQREVGLGARVLAAEWRSGHGDQEVKVLDSGLTLYVELPEDEPIPAEVLRLAPPDAEVEALLLETYWLSDTAGTVLKAVLSTGKTISAPQRHSSG